MKQYLLEINYLIGNDRRKLIGLLMLLLLSSALELMSIGLIGPFFSIIIDPKSEILKQFISLMESINLYIPHNQIFVYLSVALVIIFFAKSAMAIIIKFLIINFSNTQNKKIRTKLMNSYQRYSYNQYLERNSSEYIQAAIAYSSQYTSSLHKLVNMTSEFIITIFIVSFLAWIQWKVVLVFVVLLVFFIFCFEKIFRKVQHRAGEMQNRFNIISIQAIQEGLKGFKEIRILGKEKYFEKVIEKTTGEAMYYATRSAVILSSPRYVIETLIVTFVVITLITTNQITGDIKSVIPLLAMFGLGIFRLLPVASLFSSGFSQLSSQRFAISMLFKDLTMSNENIIESQSQISKTSSYKPFKKFNLKSIYFRYSKEANWVLSDISINIKSGDSIGIVGKSAAGKTSLLDILLGLLVPQEGEVFYNDKKINNESLLEWRSQCAYLPQEIFLLDNSLRRNVALGIADEDIDEKRLFEALRQARLSELLEQLSDGVDTMLGEHGVRLSGGQRQRVALARAFYHERSVLIMDEATSSLDKETEKEIVEEIKLLKGKTTMVIIAHRLSTVQHCDRIYRLERGRIVDEGPPERVLLKAS